MRASADPDAVPAPRAGYLLFRRARPCPARRPGHGIDEDQSLQTDDLMSQVKSGSAQVGQCNAILERIDRLDKPQHVRPNAVVADSMLPIPPIRTVLTGFSPRQFFGQTHRTHGTRKPCTDRTNAPCAKLPAAPWPRDVSGRPSQTNQGHTKGERKCIRKTFNLNYLFATSAKHRLKSRHCHARGKWADDQTYAMEFGAME
jgi:hypothetical protein